MAERTKKHTRATETTPDKFDTYLAWLNAKVCHLSAIDSSQITNALEYAYAARKAYKGSLLFEIDIEPPPQFDSYAGTIRKEMAVARCKAFLRWFKKLQDAISKSPPQPEMTLEARALAVLYDHTDWSVAKIAKAVGCSRTTLYRFDNFKASRELLKKDGIAGMPRGSKVEGSIEAWDGSS